MQNVINLKNWLDRNSVYDLKNFEHAYRLKKILEFRNQKDDTKQEEFASLEECEASND